MKRVTRFSDLQNRQRVRAVYADGTERKGVYSEDHMLEAWLDHRKGKCEFYMDEPRYICIRIKCLKKHFADSHDIDENGVLRKKVVHIEDAYEVFHVAQQRYGANVDLGTIMMVLCSIKSENLKSYETEAWKIWTEIKTDAL